MAVGQGKYDDAATRVREMTQAETVVVIAMHGTRGSGFSVQTSNPLAMLALPALLREMADVIERDTTRQDTP